MQATLQAAVFQYRAIKLSSYNYTEGPKVLFPPPGLNTAIVVLAYYGDADSFTMDRVQR